MVIESIIEQFQKSNHIDINQDYSDWEMIGKWVEENEEGWQFPSLSWQYIEMTIYNHLEKADQEELILVMKDAYENRNFRNKYFDDAIEDAEEIDFVDFEVLTEYVKSFIIKDAVRDYLKSQKEEYSIDLTYTKLFYNPIWMPEFDDIQLFSCYVPEDKEIKTVDTLLSYLIDRYRSMIQNCYRNSRGQLYRKYHEIISEPCATEKPEDLVHCLFISDKFHLQLGRLKSRAEENILPEYIIGTDAIELETDFLEILEILDRNYVI